MLTEVKGSLQSKLKLSLLQMLNYKGAYLQDDRPSCTKRLSAPNLGRLCIRDKETKCKEYGLERKSQ